MDFDKALRKQTLKYRLFLLAMGFIFLFNPLALIIAEAKEIKYIIILCFIEALIIIAVLVKVKNLYLKVTPVMDVVKIKSGFPPKQMVIVYDSILGVTVEGTGNNIKVIVIVKGHKRGNLFKSVNLAKMKRDTSFFNLAEKIATLKKEENLQYFVVSSGGIKKYKLLDVLYQRCSKAIFTSISITEIKKYRE